MKKRNLNPKEKNERVRREKDPIPWRYCLLTLVCGLILVVGFFWAARQHFSAMDLGIKNAKLRQQKENLEADQRRFNLLKEIAFSPAEIKKAAKKLGLQELTAQSIEVISPPKETKNPLEEEPKQTSIAKNKDEKTETTISEVKSKDGKSKVQTLPTTKPRTQIAQK